MSVADVERRLGPGARVEVWNEYLGRWCRGFEIAASDPQGYVLRRDSDGEILPAVIEAGRLRLSL